MEDLRLLTDDEDIIEILHLVRRKKKTIRERENHFQKWDDKDFLQRFRLSKEAVHYVLVNIRAEIEHVTNRNNAVSAEVMVLVTLRLYASGSFLQVVGDFGGIDKSTVCRFIEKVSRAVAKMHTRFIKMPSSTQEMEFNSTQFYKIAHFPSCIGALDCTHVKIASPGGDEAEVYRNRKSFFSMNVQAVCDSSCLIQNVVCRWPGSSHDSTIFQNSNIRSKFENNDYGRYLLVGDSGYANKSYLVTPFSNPSTAAQTLYNESQIRTRNPVERTFGIWKRRFPILATGIRLKLNKVEAIVVATAVLHNIAKLFNDKMPVIDPELEEIINRTNNINIDNVEQQNNLDGNRRNRIVNEHFSNLS